ncbi:unnamed protein product [Closterium sp. NIES-64]|nr:unnamed protein product [Closterium sp. NIES-64]
MGTIKEIFKPAKGEVSCLLRWYFRYSDTAMGALGDGIVDPRLCFWSRETDDNPASCITGRVRVKRVKPPSGPKEPLDIPGDVDFVYHYMYSYDFASFSDIPNDECTCDSLTPSSFETSQNSYDFASFSDIPSDECTCDSLASKSWTASRTRRPSTHWIKRGEWNGRERETRGGKEGRVQWNAWGDGGEKAVQSKEEEGATGKDESGLGDECVDAEGEEGEVK